jgi:hypothetical protein
VSESTQEITADALVSAYIAMRDKKSAMEAKYQSELKPLIEQMELVESAMRDMCKTVGADSIRTPYGTIIRSIKTRYSTTDWGSLYKIIQEKDAFDLLEKRIHQGNMKTFLEDNPDIHPEGLNIDREYAVTVRRK